MPKTKISEFSATPGNNTDIDGINIAEGCAPSGINDAIRELMAQLKDFQAGTAGDSFNGPVGTTTAAAGAFTTLSASGAVTLSGGTANGVPYLNGSKVLTSGSSLVFDGTNLGIGTSSTLGNSTVNAVLGFAARNSGTTPGYFQTYNSNAGSDLKTWRLGGDSSGNFVLQTVNDAYSSATTRLTADAAGNLGLGVTPSAWFSTSRVLQLGSGGAVEARSNYSPYISTTSNAFLSTGGTYTYIATAAAARYLQDAGAHSWFTAPSGTAGNAISFTQAMTLNSSSQLGIGTTTVSDRLTLGGGRIKIEASPVSQFIGNDGSDTALQLAADFIKFQTGGSYTERARIDSSGNLLVGTTTPAQTISTNNVLTLKAPGVAAVWGVGPTSSFGSFYVSTGGVGVSLAGGATSWGTVSDERHKDIIEPIVDATNKVVSLRAVIGKYKADADGTRRSFLIAQDVQAVLPEAVDEDEQGVLGLRYTEVIPLLTAAIQEQQAIIEQLTTRIAALEAK